MRSKPLSKREIHPYRSQSIKETTSASVHKVHFGDKVNVIEKLLGSEISSMHDVEVDLQIVGIFGGITCTLPNVIPI